MWTIDKQFDFCYGHRVWSQKLQEGFATDLCLACRHLHGHQGSIKVYLSAAELTDGMVTDFKHLGWFKKWLDDTLDHKFIMDINDPLLTRLFPDYKRFLDGIDELSGAQLNIDSKVFDYVVPEVQELYEGLVLVNFVPTSENLAQWICQVVEKKMKPLGVTVEGVEFNETPKSRSAYYN